MPEVRSKGGRRGRAKDKPLRVDKRGAEARKPASRWWIYLAAGALALYLVFQVYAPALNGPFVFDDTSQPYHSQDYSGDLRIWMHGVRPLLMLSYWLNYQHSPAPFGFHVVNVLIHLLNGVFIFVIVRKLLRRDSSDWLLPAFAAAVFLLHPIQTEAVSYIAGRSETLSVLFFLAAFTVFLCRPSPIVSWKISAAVLLLFSAAVATKEHTLTLPALLLLTDYYWNPAFSFSGIRRNWRLYLPIGVGALAGLAFVARMLAQATSAGFALKDLTWYQYFFTQCRVFFVYLRLLLFPVGQNLDWDYSVSRNILDHGAVFALAAILLLAAAAIYFRRRYPLASYGFLVYLLLMAPTSSFVPIKDMLAERRLYLPMVGILLVVTAALARLTLDRRKLAAALCGILTLFAVLTYRRNQLWASDTALWEDAAYNSPHKQRVHFQLGHIYFTDGRCAEAIAQFALAARLSQPDYGLLVDWGLAYECADQPEAAVSKLREAAALDPTAHVYTQIAMVYAKRSHWPEALDALTRAEKLDPKYAITYYYRGGVRAKTGDFAGAVEDYRHALLLDPQLQPAREGLAYAEQRLDAPR